jgi:hypothetical protein
MNFDTLPHQLFGSLLIGAETFVIAALWPVSEWAVGGRRRTGLVVALLVVALCVGLGALGLVPSMWPSTGWHRVVGRLVGWVPLPLFLGLPAAVCVASGQSLARAGVPARYARATALCMAAFAVVVAPFATVIAACGLSGVCV